MGCLLVETFKEIPRTIEEAINQVLSGWSLEEQKSFKELKMIELLDLHGTLGADIRNVFSLWYGNDSLLKDCLQFQKQEKEFVNRIVEIQKEFDKKKLEEMEATGDLDIMDFQELYSDSRFILKENDMDPHIASILIIFATWNHLQDRNHNL